METSGVMLMYHEPLSDRTHFRLYGAASSNELEDQNDHRKH